MLGMPGWAPCGAQLGVPIMGKPSMAPRGAQLGRSSTSQKMHMSLILSEGLLA